MGVQPLSNSTKRQTRSKQLFVWFALAAAIACGIALRLVHYGDVTSRSPDERTYTYRAQLILDGGLRQLRPVFANYVSNSDNWIQPPPTRVGHLLAFAAMMKIRAVRDFSAGSLVSLLASILSLLLVAWTGVRFFNPWVAAGATTFMAFSVGELGMSRRAWGDSFFGFISLVILYLACEITRSPRRVFLYPLFIAVGTYAMLTKETSSMSYGICGLWVFGVLLWKERLWKSAALMAAGGLVSIAATLAVWAVAAGSLSGALSVLGDVQVDSQWSRLNTGGPWYQFGYLLWLVGPLTAAMALTGVALAVLPAKIRTRVIPETGALDLLTTRLATLIAVSFVLFASFVGELQYLRIISPADGPYCLLAGIGLWILLSIARQFLSVDDFKALVLAAVFAVVIEGLMDYRTFTVVVRSGMEDLTALWIRGALGR